MTSIILPSNTTDPSQITSNTLPTTRVNPSTGLPSGGADLQIGDRWYNPTTGKEGFWNGALWLSAIPFVFQGFRVLPSSSIVSFTVDCLDGGLFFESFNYNIAANVFNWDASNYQSLSIEGLSPNGVGITILSNVANGKMQYDNPADFRLQKKSIAINFANLFSSTTSNTISRQINIIFAPVGSINGVFTFSLVVRGILT